jgi:hypothetical protein
VETYILDAMQLVPNRHTSWFSSLNQGNETHLKYILGPGRVLCSVDDLKTVKNYIKYLDDPDLHSAYVAQRTALVHDVHKACRSTFVKVYSRQMLT